MAKAATDQRSRSKRPRRKAAAKTKARLAPGQLDDLVLGHMRKSRSAAPHTAGAIARSIGRSAGAVANCLIRLEKAGKVRLARKGPRAYDLPQRGK